jgi:nucleoside 2-deoxyribosyltransferase
MNKIKVYVAGSWTDRMNMKHHITRFSNLGYEITHDWTESEKQHVDTRSIDQQCYCATLDINGVKDADVVVAIMDNPKYAYRGLNCEMGCALGLDIPVLIYNPNPSSYCSTNVFYWHGGVSRFIDLDELIESLSVIKSRNSSSTYPPTASQMSQKSRSKELSIIYKLIVDAAEIGDNKIECKLNNKTYVTNKLIDNEFSVNNDRNTVITW